MTTPSIVPAGTSIRTLHGELDRDENDLERHTPPGTVGRIVRVDTYPASPAGERVHHHVVFPEGGWVTLYENEIGNPDCYEIV
jgi:hypothetical protein